MSKKKRWIPGIVGFCLILGATGCAGLADTGNTYALDQRIETFASSGSGRTADGFAADLAVVTDGIDGDGTLTAQSAGVFPLDGGNAVFAPGGVSFTPLAAPAEGVVGRSGGAG